MPSVSPDLVVIVSETAWACVSEGFNGDTPKWMVYSETSQSKMANLEVPLFSETPRVLLQMPSVGIFSRWPKPHKGSAPHGMPGYAGMPRNLHRLSMGLPRKIDGFIENPKKLMSWRYPYFRKPPYIYIYIYIYTYIYIYIHIYIHIYIERERLDIYMIWMPWSPGSAVRVYKKTEALPGAPASHNSIFGQGLWQKGWPGSHCSVWLET